MQNFLNDRSALEDFLANQKLFVVHGNSARNLDVGKFLLSLDSKSFTNFEQNPRIESVNLGVEEFQKKNFDLIVAIGGGSAIDVAKGIKLYSARKVPLLAIPTTAGSGSESTRFSVVYKDGVKQSLTDNSILPDAVFLDSTVLKSLSDNQRKVSLLDALCHAIESMWSVNATSESKKYSREAIQLILENVDEYLENRQLESIMLASNLAGRAINISQTTAGHAMSYKLTSEFGLKHGHAVAICVRVLWNFMKARLDSNLSIELEPTMKRFEKILDDWKIGFDQKLSEDQIEMLASSVNQQRLSNNPIQLDHKTLKNLYREIVL